MFDKEFKEAIAELPSKEKDKLIIRLLRKDLPLANRLYFELIDDRSVDDRRIEMEERIKKKVKAMSDRYYSPGYLLMDVRYLSGEITEHVKTTKDKFGEASLNILMLQEVINCNSKRILKVNPAKSKKLCVYIIARAFKILTLIVKLHEDYRIDFEEPLKKLGELIGANDKLMRTAIYHGLDVNWLLTAEIPEDILEIQRELRSKGYLK